MAFLEGETYSGRRSELTIVFLTAKGSGESSRTFASRVASASPVAKKYTVVGEAMRIYSPALAQLLKTDAF